MAYVPGVLLILAIIVLALGGMAWGWRRRTRRDAGLAAPTGAATGATLGAYTGLYVATTRHDAPLDRLAIRHLAFRSRVTVTVTSDGVALDLPGAPTVFLDRARLVAADRATWTIDRVVERDGLVRIVWRADGDAVCDSYIRLQSDRPDALVASVRGLLTDTELTGADT